MPAFSARSTAAWITGPSAIGSENGTPSSSTSTAPESISDWAMASDSAGRRVAQRDIGDQRALAFGAEPVELLGQLHMSTPMCFATV